MHTLTPRYEADPLAIKKQFYLADAQAAFLGELSSQRLNQVIERYASIVLSYSVDDLLSVAEWSELFAKTEPVDHAQLPERLTYVERLAVLETLETVARRKGNAR